MIEGDRLVGVVFSGLSGLVIGDVTDEGELIRVRARSRRVPVPCPECAVETAHVHGWCERTVADVPVDGRPVVLDVVGVLLNAQCEVRINVQRQMTNKRGRVRPGNPSGALIGLQGQARSLPDSRVSVRAPAPGRTGRSGGRYDRLGTSSRTCSCTRTCTPTDVRMRWLACRDWRCPPRTFREQLAGLLERYQRRTVRLTVQVGAVARELAGRARARLLSVLGMPVSRHTALRALLRIPFELPPVRRTS
ncbi:hypothetical protein E1200_22020 [Actinomadura sp. GC306]|nr:hypothetical protein E1200_22020 [Actinomadura sp. GC306]